MESSTKNKGACANFFILLLVTALVVLGALADNDLIFREWPAVIKGFSLYFLAAFGIGTA